MYMDYAVLHFFFASSLRLMSFIRMRSFADRPLVALPTLPSLPTLADGVAEAVSPAPAMVTLFTGLFIALALVDGDDEDDGGASGSTYAGIGGRLLLLPLVEGDAAGDLVRTDFVPGDVPRGLLVGVGALLLTLPLALVPRLSLNETPELVGGGGIGGALDGEDDEGVDLDFFSFSLLFSADFVREGDDEDVGGVDFLPFVPLVPSDLIFRGGEALNAGEPPPILLAVSRDIESVVLSTFCGDSGGVEKAITPSSLLPESTSAPGEAPSAVLKVVFTADIALSSSTDMLFTAAAGVAAAPEVLSSLT